LEIIVDDIFTKPLSTYVLADYRVLRMVLAPKHWQACNLPVTLSWRGVKFTQRNAAQVPKHANGVYSFVVKPEIANHPSCAYLLYVGKAKKQVLRDRFIQYIDERAKGDKSRRPHVTEMLLKWDGFLWFYFAEISSGAKINKVEDCLLAAYLPPSNRIFPSSVRHAVKKLFAH
jgi:hypothetical protein